MAQKLLEFYSLNLRGTMLLIGKNALQTNRQEHQGSKHITTTNPDTICK